MEHDHSDRRDAWTSISIFLIVLAGLSAVAHFAIVGLSPASIYVGALMWCPAISAFATLKIRGRALRALPWTWGNWPTNWAAYAVPIVYISVACALVWLLGLGGVPDPETIAEWSQELGLSTAPPFAIIATMVVLLSTIQLIKSLGSIAGEEIGWRGFFVWELRKVMPFGAVSIASGLVWAIWHYPIIIAYGGGDPIFQLACFTLMIVSMSVIMTYFTFRSESVWPAIFFHAAHNIYIQKIFSPLTIANENSGFWIDEYGLMIPIVVTVGALYYWRKAKSEGM